MNKNDNKNNEKARAQKTGNASFRGQGAFEYIMIISGAIFLVLIVTVLMQSALNPQISTTQTGLDETSAFLKCTTPGVNLIPNAGFENNAVVETPNDLPDKWTATSGTPTYELNTGSKYGKKGVQVDSSKIIENSDFFELNANTPHRLIVYAKGNGGIYLSLLQYSLINPMPISTPTNLVITDTMNGEYKKYEFSGNTDSDGNFGKIEITAQSGASATVELVCLIEESA